MLDVTIRKTRVLRREWGSFDGFLLINVRKQPNDAYVSLRTKTVSVALMLLMGACWDELPQGSEPEASSTGSVPETSGSSSGDASSGGLDPLPGTSIELEELGQEGGGFLDEPDLGANGEGCDIFSQDCPGPHQKCALFANDGSSTPNATHCVGIFDEPAKKGEPCWTANTSDSGLTGIDSCDFGLMCWDVDPETGIGLCLALCEGDEGHPTCFDPDEACASKMPVCFPRCRPLEGNCPAGCGCYPVGDMLTCSPDASGDMGAYGDPCEFTNVCDPGNVCAGAEAVPSCPDGSAGCCTEFCDLTAPDCPEAELGVECLPWYEEGAAGAGYENLGVCVLPA
jgi:hypothetical protein